MSEERDTIQPAVLQRCPGCFALPTCDPNALALETLLRIHSVHFVKKDSPMSDLCLRVPRPSPDTPAAAAAASHRSKKSPAVVYNTYKGLAACMSSVGASADTDVIHNDLKPVMACIEALTVRCLFPAFIFLTHYEPNLFNYAVRRSVVPKVGTLWESMRGSFRLSVLKSNIYYYSGAPVTALPKTVLSMTVTQKIGEVLEDVEKALKALELLHVSHARADEAFLLGTSHPCSADAYAYAGASCFLHADFGTTHGSGQLVEFQKRMREECPLLLKYVEKLRQMLFEEYSGAYSLKPSVDNSTEIAAASLEDMYQSGRLSTLLWTGLFATLYFLVANADTLVGLLEEEEGEKLEAEQSSASSKPAGSVPQLPTSE